MLENTIIFSRPMGRTDVKKNGLSNRTWPTKLEKKQYWCLCQPTLKSILLFSYLQSIFCPIPFIFKKFTWAKTCERRNQTYVCVLLHKCTNRMICWKYLVWTLWVTCSELYTLIKEVEVKLRLSHSRCIGVRYNC